MSKKDEYDIVILGASESGKTTFLACLYHRLFQAPSNIGFGLTLSDANQRKILGNRFRSLRNGEGWLPSTETTEITEWNFDCSIKVKRDKKFVRYTPFHFNYLDYAGEISTDFEGVNQNIQNDFYSRLENASVILCLLDGVKILRHIQGTKKGITEESKHWRSLEDDLDQALSDIESGMEPIPVHFVISKWDVLHNAGISLETVRDELFKIQAFRIFVDERVSGEIHIPVRLIPVSSVGMDFASLQPDGQMVKNLQAPPAPFQVEMPVACAIFDYWYVQIQELEDQFEKEKEKHSKEIIEKNVPWYERLYEFMGRHIERLSELLATRSEFAGDMLLYMGDYLQKPAYISREQAAAEAAHLKQQRDQLLSQVKDKRTALHSIMKSMEVCIRSLTNDFPASELTSDDYK